MAIGVGGLMSGLDTNSIITQMMQLERRPILLLQNKEAGIQARISALGSLKSGLSGLQTATVALKSASGFSAMQATSGNTTVLTATASSSAMAGNYQVEVSILAKAQQVRSSAFAASDTDVGTGVLTITVGSGTPVNITIGVADDHTLAGIAAAINDAEAGVTAGVVNDGSGNYYLTLSAGETGTANTISLSIDDDDLVDNDAAGLSKLYNDPVTGTMFETQAAANAALLVNGIPVTRSGNTISDLIDGVTLTLKQADAGNPFELVVARDNATVSANIKSFVTKYNSLVDTLKALSGYDAATKQGGILQGDSLTRQAQSQVRDFIHRQFGDSGQAVRRLNDLGLSVDEDGKLSLDETTLDSALADNRAAVETFFTSTVSGSEGFAVQLDTTLDGYLQSDTGLLAAKEEGLQSSVKQIANQVERIELRLIKREEVLRRQFESLENLMAQFNSTSGALEQQLESLANLNANIAKRK